MSAHREEWEIRADEAMVREGIAEDWRAAITAHEFMRCRQAFIEQQVLKGADRDAATCLWDANNMSLLSDEVRSLVVGYCQAVINALGGRS